MDKLRQYRTVAFLVAITFIILSMATGRIEVFLPIGCAFLILGMASGRKHPES